MTSLTRTRSAISVACCALAVTIAAWAGGPPRASACNTPVFRYAMYNWPPAPYYVFYFHHGQAAQGDEAVNKTLEELYRAEPPTNVALEVIDATQEEQSERLPAVVKEAFESDAEGTAPIHLVFSAWGVKLHAGRLDAEKVRAMVDSPVRKQLGKLFDEGNAAVLLILTGPDKEKNQQAEKVAAKVLAKAASGEIPVASAVGDFGTPEDFLPESPDGTSQEDDQDESPNGLKVGLLKVSRSDAAEKWLVDSLLAIEPDLRDEEFAQEPMVFAVYGRGRAMPPYIGKGITVENVTDCVAFLGSACSCMVKEQNPGMDLLMQWDWEKTAEAMAATDAQLSSGPFGYQEYAPDESGEWTEAPSTEPATAETPPAGDPEPGEPGTAAEDTAAADAGPPTVQKRVEESEPAGSPQPQTSVGAKTRAPWATQSFAARQGWKIGLGLAFGAVVVMIAGFVFVRRQRPG